MALNIPIFAALVTAAIVLRRRFLMTRRMRKIEAF